MPKILQGGAEYAPKDITEIVLRRQPGTDWWHLRVIATPSNEAYIVYDTHIGSIDAAAAKANELLKE